MDRNKAKMLCRRYLHLGSDHPFYIRKKEPFDIEQGLRILCADTADDRVKELQLKTVAQQMELGSLVRNDECLFTLAYLARSFSAPEKKHAVYELIPTVIDSFKDLCHFLHFYCTMHLRPTSVNEDAGGKLGKDRKRVKGFGNGIKVALAKWYDKKSPEQLAEMFAVDRRWYNFSHRDVLRMAHIKLKDAAKMRVLDAAAGGPGINRPAKPKKESQQPETANPVDSPVEPPSENKSSEADTSVAVYRRMKEFKSVKTAKNAALAIKMYDYPLELVPSQLRRSRCIWETLFPRMAYRDIIGHAVALQDYKLLTHKDTNFSKKYCNVINSLTAVYESKVNPIFVHQKMRSFEMRRRYSGVVKELYHTLFTMQLWVDVEKSQLSNSLQYKQVRGNKSVVNRLNEVLNYSLLYHRRKEVRYFITMDVSSKMSKKSIFRNQLMSCHAAYVLLALPILKKEPFATVMSFSENFGALRSVLWTKEMEFLQALDHLQSIASKKTKVNIADPISYADKSNTKVDVFITIVDSLIRVNPKRKPPLQALNDYNNKHQRFARYVIINLCRHQMDLDVDISKFGVMVIAGCSEETPQLIDAFVNGHFD